MERNTGGFFNAESVNFLSVFMVVTIHCYIYTLNCGYDERDQVDEIPSGWENGTI